MSNKIKVLFILPDLEPGGAQRVIITIFKRISREYFDPHLLIINSKGPMRNLLKDDLKIHKLGNRRVRDSIFHIIRYSHSIRPDVIISTLGHLNLVMSLIKKFLPRKTILLVREANTPSMSLKYTSNPSLYFSLYRLLYHLSDGIICNSYYMKKDMEELFPRTKAKTVLLRNPVDTRWIREMSGEFTQDYPDGVFRLVSVGMLSYQKGFDRILKVLDLALKKVPDLHLTIVGGGIYLYELKRLVHNYGIGSKVTLTGYQTNPYPYIKGAHLFVSGSRWEGMPNAVLESLACGTPVIAFDCPGGISEIINDGKNGWLIKNGDIKGMADRIYTIFLNKEYVNISQNEMLPSCYLVENVVKSYEKLILKYLGNN